MPSAKQIQRIFKMANLDFEEEFNQKVRQLNSEEIEDESNLLLEQQQQFEQQLLQLKIRQKLLREQKQLAEERRLAEEAEEREKKRIEAERIEKERIQAEENEKKRIEAERIEKERIEAEEREKKRIEAERIEKERIEAEEHEKKRIEAEERKKKKIEAERLEQELQKAVDEEARKQQEKKKRKEEKDKKKKRDAKDGKEVKESSKKRSRGKDMEAYHQEIKKRKIDDASSTSKPDDFGGESSKVIGETIETTETVDDTMRYLGFLTDACPNLEELEASVIPNEQQSAGQYPIQEESTGNEQQNQFVMNNVLEEGIKRVIETIEPLITQKAQEPSSTKKTNRTMNSFVRNEWSSYVENAKIRSRTTMTELNKISSNVINNFNYIASVLNTVVEKLNVVENRLARVMDHTGDRRPYDAKKRWRAQSEYRR